MIFYHETLGSLHLKMTGHDEGLESTDSDSVHCVVRRCKGMLKRRTRTRRHRVQRQSAIPSTVGQSIKYLHCWNVSTAVECAIEGDIKNKHTLLYCQSINTDKTLDRTSYSH